MAEKRYYWLKLHKDFFKRHEIRIIEDMPNGKDYILFYLKLLVESVTHEGALRFSDAIPYNEQMLATITNTNVDIVKAAMQIFIELHMIELLDDQTIFMAEVEEMIGSETDAAERMRKSRERKALKDAECNNVTPMLQERYIENRDKRIDNRDKNIKSKRFARPSVEEIAAYVKENKLNVIAEEFFDYYEGNGWKVGKNAMKDWKAACRNWSRRENSFAKISNEKQKAKPNFDMDAMKQKAILNDDFDI